MSTTVWEADAPGTWSLDLTHVPPGSTTLVQAIMRTSFPAGNRRMFADLGAPLDTLDATFVNGFFYSRLRPLIGADRPSARTPPVFLIKLVARVHPEFRRRARTAKRTLATEPWKQVIADWRDHGRTEVETVNLALQDVDLDGLDDADVARHARTCFDHCVASWEHHFWLHGYDLGPLGQYLYEGHRWGLSASELLALLEGASPSTATPRRLLTELRAIVDAFGTSPTTLDEVRAISPEAASALDGYLRYRGAQLFSRYDVDGVTLGERPDLVLASIRSAEHREPSEAIAERAAALRQRVPVAERARFDDVLRQARDAMDLRDDNGPNTAEWPLGLLRLALLELGRRMVLAGAARQPEQALELRPDELSPALFSSGQPGADELDRRAAQRAAQRALDAPPTIGPPEAPPPPADALPASLATLVGMVQIVVEQMAMGGDRSAAASDLHGVGVGTTTMRGIARVADSPEEALDKLEPGDVLVVASTTPAFNLVLSIAGAVVTSQGGSLSHAAVLARELGIPAVVGAAGALTAIPDGAEVEVDPVAGEVRVITPV